jgi:plasmid replication initiation protein
MPQLTENYVIQPNSISRAIYIMPTMARRLILLSIFKVQIDRPADMKISMDLRELALQFGFMKTKRYKQLKNAIDTASRQVLRFEKEDGSLTEWIPWLTYCCLDEKTKQVTIHINEYLYDYVLDIRQSEGFSVLLLSDYLKIESQYAYRWFEIINSRGGHADNRGQFFIRYTLDEIRIRFVIDGKKYNNINNLKTNVFDKPIKEINEKKIGFTVNAEYVYKQNKTTVILRCSFAKREDGSYPLAYYTNRYPKEFFNCFAAAKRSIEFNKFRNEKSYEITCMQKALELLKARLPNA